MRRRLHTTLVYFGLAEDPDLDARLRERELSGAWEIVGGVGGVALPMLAVAALWALARLVGVDTGLTELAIAEGLLVLLFAMAQLLGDEQTSERRARRSPWREWGEHLSGIVVLWSLVFLAVALLGHRPTAESLGAIGLWCASITVVDAVRFAWRALRGARTS
ncbi:MAG TPA: hypothetical protein VFG42_03390 [Baekduia sp.]|uniref:hypothetical protein n=1 Tax=Baekduia sp. TaxID=2600305 RepID=UPI002D79BE31|nr:hypothetical protein [Baekduia sp.]HET6505813.1 hypothetical protein [Baekduia sp.]